MDLSTLRDNVRARMPEAISELRARARERAPDSLGRREAGYTIANVAGDDAVIRIYDEIWFLGVNADDFVRDLADVTAPRIRVEINSPGGDVFDGIAIYNALRTHPAHVTTRVDGIAASIASVIAQAGDHRVMLGASQMMIHNAFGMTVGDATEHGEMQVLLEQQDEIIAGIYATRSGGDRDNFRALMNAETWMSDDRAVAEGLADEVVEPERKTENRAPTLHDEISGAVETVSGVLASAERLDASCAEKGQTLSLPKREALDELNAQMGRLTALLSTEPKPADDITGEYARFVAFTQGVAL